MSKIYIAEKTYTEKDFLKDSLPKADFELCQFIHCNFSSADISGVNFTDCDFENCNLSSAKTIQTTFNNVRFRDCKMLGLHFETTNEFLFTVNFKNCQLNLSSFYRRKMKKTVFDNCQFKEADFTETDLAEAIFSFCDLENAKFENSVLEKADLRTSFNYSIDPEINKMKKAKFSYPEVIQLLAKYQLEIE
jgi:fluoroquinolone resistance protein